MEQEAVKVKKGPVVRRIAQAADYLIQSPEFEETLEVFAVEGRHPRLCDREDLPPNNRFLVMLGGNLGKDNSPVLRYHKGEYIIGPNADHKKAGWIGFILASWREEA